jgi:hypothetical protein
MFAVMFDFRGLMGLTTSLSEYQSVSRNDRPTSHVSPNIGMRHTEPHLAIVPVYSPYGKASHYKIKELGHVELLHLAGSKPHRLPSLY